MDTLQLQDVFEPYYAGRETRPGKGRVTKIAAQPQTESPVMPDRKARLDSLSRRFARAARRAAPKEL